MQEIILGNKSKNILPFEIQREYIKYHDLVDSQELPADVLFSEAKKLFLKKTSIAIKKKFLYLMAHNGTNEAYKLLKKYLKKPDKELRIWAELCVQECAGNLGAELLGQEETFMVMSGAGGDGQRLRYFFIFSSVKSKPLTIAQKSLIEESVKETDKKLKGKTEKINFGNNYFLISVLLPTDVSAEMYFQDLYKVANSKKEVLRYHYYCNNVQEPASEDIDGYLKELK